ncbi:hypothetical protein [Caproiciproducens sp. CPB-2]|uniref:hypothetical protein n=1 Tax=unclassified Caproiciproducens TaxID=2643836 RepID=UPI0023D99715|nr:hypothetical protein [Caproiciproducens sp. CPB-2]MDF1495293.1 hypothetical protein [Caproiciproducens sp. CPB-2]
MSSMIVFLILYAILIVFDLIPVLKKRDKKALWFSIPVYLITLTANIMLSFSADITGSNKIISQIISSIFH